MTGIEKQHMLSAAEPPCTHSDALVEAVKTQQQRETSRIISLVGLFCLDHVHLAPSSFLHAISKHVAGPGSL